MKVTVSMVKSADYALGWNDCHDKMQEQIEAVEAERDSIAIMAKGAVALGAERTLKLEQARTRIAELESEVAAWRTRFRDYQYNADFDGVQFKR